MLQAISSVRGKGLGGGGLDRVDSLTRPNLIAAFHLSRRRIWFRLNGCCGEEINKHKKRCWHLRLGYFYYKNTSANVHLNRVPDAKLTKLVSVIWLKKGYLDVFICVFIYLFRHLNLPLSHSTLAFRNFSCVVHELGLGQFWNILVHYVYSPLFKKKFTSWLFLPQL